MVAFTQRIFESTTALPPGLLLFLAKACNLFLNFSNCYLFKEVSSRLSQTLCFNQQSVRPLTKIFVSKPVALPHRNSPNMGHLLWAPIPFTSSSSFLALVSVLKLSRPAVKGHLSPTSSSFLSLVQRNLY
ncbi:hypothetical protein YC2023_038605 [Brassica napus]